MEKVDDLKDTPLVDLLIDITGFPHDRRLIGNICKELNRRFLSLVHDNNMLSNRFDNICNEYTNKCISITKLEEELKKEKEHVKCLILSQKGEIYE